MKTREFIKMIQEADPSGEAHVRISGIEVPMYALCLPGYYDGSYSYIDEDGKFVYSSSGTKVDIHMKDIWDFVDDIIEENKDVSYEQVKKNFRFELGNEEIPHVKDKIDSILKDAKEAYDHITVSNKESYERHLKENREKSEKGWTWFQNKLVDTEGREHHFYTWKIYDENGKEKGSNLANTETVSKSGEWEKLDNNIKEGYYQWIKIENKK